MSEMLTPDFVHDHGKWMLAFTMVWAYFNFSQWLIIWAEQPAFGNHLLSAAATGRLECNRADSRRIRFRRAFRDAALASFKRNIRKLVWLAVWMILIRYLDLFGIIEPNFSKTITVTLADIVVPIAIGGIWLWYFFRNLAALPLAAGL